MKKYKFSKYNIIIREDENNVIIYNCYRGGIIKLEKKLYNLISKSYLSLNDIGEHAQTLLNDGYIVDCNIDEYQKCKLIKEENIMADLPEIVTYIFAPTLNCNLNCIYCFEKLNRKAQKQVPSDETLQNIINFIIKDNENNTNLKTILIHWFGGEPLLCFDQIITFSKKLKTELTKRNINLVSQMTTNGVLLSEEKLHILTEECGLQKVQITLDGEVDSYCRKKQTTEEIYEQVLNNIVCATKYVKTTVRINADKSNFNEFQNLMHSLFKLPLIKENIIIHFAQIKDYTGDSNVENTCFNDYEFWKYKNEFYKFLSEQGYQSIVSNSIPSFTPISYCGIRARHNFVIDYEGNLYKCEHYLGEKDKIVGDVLNGIYYNKEYKNALTFSGDNRCKNCNIYPCCNYAECSSMHSLTGKKECTAYDVQTKVIKDSIIKLYNLEK